MAAPSPSPSHLRSLYRRLLRELPSRRPSLLANPSPLKHHIRTTFAPATNSTSTHAPSNPVEVTQAAEEFVQYLKAQRLHTTLIERYNPGLNMADEDRIRLSARRVGMNMPEEYSVGDDAKKKKD